LSENKISIPQIEKWLIDYKTRGIFDVISGMLIGRPSGSFKGYSEELNFLVQKIVTKESGRDDIPIITDMDFGHTDPIFIVPNGAYGQIDPINHSFKIINQHLIS